VTALPRGRARDGLRRLARLLPRASDWTPARRSPARDLLAGLTVAIVALPLALAFGVASGLGAEAGLVTAVVAGAIAAVFGGSNVQVSGPTGAMTVVLLPVVHSHGVDGVLQVGIMAGVMLLALAVSGAGRHVRLLPSSLIEGFTAGIAVVIALQQVPNMLGLVPGDQEKVWALAWDAVLRFAQAPDPVPLAIAIGVAAVIVLGSRWRPAIPFSLLAVIVATLVIRLPGIEVPVIGPLASVVPVPTLGFFDPGRIGELVPSALAVAALAALESLLCATVADAMSVGERHDPDRELFGQGLANLAAPVFGGVPATAAIARTAVNVRSGARSRLASLFHAAVLAAVMVVASPLVGGIPLAALGGVLLATTIQMVDFGSIATLARATRPDAAVLAITFAVTVAIDLVSAVAIGLGVAVLLGLRSVARSARLEQVPLDADGADTTAEEHALLVQHIVAYRLDGPLFFAAAHRFLLELTQIAAVDVVILRMSRVSTMDASGAAMLDDAIARLEHRGIVVLLSGIRPGHDRILGRLGVGARLQAAGRIFPDTPAAIGHARELLALGGG